MIMSNFEFVMLIVWIVLTVVVHEACHYYSAKYLGLKPIFAFEGWDPTVYYQGKEDNVLVVLAGVLGGWYFYSVSFFFLGFYPFLIGVGLYAYGIKKDLAILWRLTR